MGEKRKVLKHQPDVAALWRHKPTGSCHFLTVEQHTTPVGPLDTGRQSKQCCLPATGRTEQTDDLAWCKAETDVFYSGGTAKSLCDPLKGQEAGESGASRPARAPAARVTGLGPYLVAAAHLWLPSTMFVDEAQRRRPRPAIRRRSGQPGSDLHALRDKAHGRHVSAIPRPCPWLSRGSRPRATPLWSGDSPEPG